MSTTAKQEPIVLPSDKERIYFVTDAHLGSGADSRERERQLCQLLDEMDPHNSVLILLGDMFDFWFSYRYTVPRGGTRFLGKLSAMGDLGMEIHYFTGNHDMWMFDYLNEECSLTLHTDPTIFVIGDKRFLVGHGDGMESGDKMFNLWRKMFRSRFNQWLFGLLPPAITFPIAHRWSANNKRKHEREGAAIYLGEEREGIVRCCKERIKREKIDFCLFGHRHTPVVVSLGEHTTYVNVGDWLRHRNYAVYETNCCKLTLHDKQTYSPRE